MKKLLVAATLVATATLAACQTGTAEFAALPGTGKLTQTRMIQAKGYCQMATQNSVPAMQGDYVGAFQFAKACFASQGLLITGFRQKDGRLTQAPFTGTTGGKFPPAPKLKRKL